MVCFTTQSGRKSLYGQTSLPSQQRTSAGTSARGRFAKIRPSDGCGRLETIAKAHPKVISEVRGKGLMLGLKCVVENAALSAKLLENGLITIVAGDNVVRIVPPLIIDESHVEEAAGILETSCAALAEEA